MNETELNFMWELYTHVENENPGDDLVEALIYFSMKYEFDIEELPSHVFTAVKNRIKEIWDENKLDFLEEIHQEETIK